MNLTKKISITILNELMLSKTVDEKNYKKTLYGFEIIVSVFFQTLGLVILGIFIGILDKMIPVAMSFALLRLFAGGYHADTSCKCFILTFIMCIFGIEMAEFISASLFSMIIVATVSLILIIILAPVDTPYKRMTKKGRITNKKRSLVVLIILLSVVFILHVFSLIDMVYPALILSGLFLESISLLIKITQ
jgi:accessory gene regulator B